MYLSSYSMDKYNVIVDSVYCIFDLADSNIYLANVSIYI